MMIPNFVPLFLRSLHSLVDGRGCVSIVIVSSLIELDLNLQIIITDLQPFVTIKKSNHISSHNSCKPPPQEVQDSGNSLSAS